MDSDHSSSSHKQHPSQSHDHRHQPSPTQLLSSAKVVAGAAKSALHQEAGKLDKAEVAGAAADLLGAASHYAKLEEGKFGKYVDKAEQYLHQYQSSHAGHPPSSSHAGHPPSSSQAAGAAHDGGGLEDYLKMAQGFLKKQ